MNMKKILLSSAVVLAALFTGCDNNEKELARLANEKDSLIAVASIKDKSIEEFVTSFEEIQGNLAEITAKQETIAEKTEGNPEMSTNTRERINAEIATIKQLMDESKAKVDELNKKVKSSNSRIRKFEKMIASLNEQIATKDSQLVVLNDQLLALNTQVETLNTTVGTLSTKDSVNTKTIQDQTTKINTAYVAMGSYKKLRDEQVITRQGGFLGLGKEEELAANINQEAFTRVDITQLSNIPVNTKEVEMVTVHPMDSYSIEKQDDKVSEIRITDPEKFWSTSKYLVVMTK
jgi:predicted  nucleic acid-binding Zn-ribbon protein